MKTLLVNERLVKLLRAISLESVKIFGKSDERKAKNLTDSLNIVKDFDGLCIYLSIFMDPIAGHHERLDEDEQKLFMKIHTVVDEARKLYTELPDINEDDFTAEKLRASFMKFSDNFHIVQSKRTVEEKYLAVERMPQNQQNTIHFLYHCLLVQRIEKNLTTACEILDIEPIVVLN